MYKTLHTSYVKEIHLMKDEIQDDSRTDDWENLKQQTKDTRFKPGQSGNPAGRPKGDKTITALARKHLEELVSNVGPFKKLATSLGLTDKDTTVKDVVAMSLILNSVKGKSAPLHHLLNRIDGKIQDGGAIGLDAKEAAEKIREAMEQINALENNEVPEEKEDEPEPTDESDDTG